MSRRLLPLFFLPLLLVVPCRSEAALISGDLLAPGDGAVTIDTSTGLEWLDVPLTAGLSVREVQDGVGGWAALGFREATGAELCGLFGEVTLVPSTCPPTGPGASLAIASGDTLADLQALLGTTYQDASYRSTAGFYDDGDTNPDVGLASALYSAVDDTSNTQFQNNAATLDDAYALRGHFLVRSVPEPGSAILLLEGTCLLAMLGVRTGGPRRLTAERVSPAGRGLPPA